MRNLVNPSNTLLQQPLQNFDLLDPPEDPKDIAQILFDNMTARNGLGLAANQIGLPYRVFIMRGDPCTVCFNPTITYASEETILLEEGCLTYPDLFVKVRRPRLIRAKWTDELGQLKTSKFDGMTARVFQHELDHLNGVVHIDLATKYHKDQAMKRLKKIRRMKKRI